MDGMNFFLMIRFGKWWLRTECSANYFSLYLCFGSWWQLPLVVHGKVCPAKSVITFCCIKKLLLLQTEIQRSKHSLNSVACYLWLLGTGLCQNQMNTTIASLVLPTIFRNHTYSVPKAMSQKMLPWAEWSQVCGETFYSPASYRKYHRTEAVPLPHSKMIEEKPCYETAQSKADLKAQVQTFTEWY